jgi:pilus assembly protein CpaE
VIARIPHGNGTRVLAIGPTADARLVLRALRGAVDDYLDESDLDREIHSALARWNREQSARAAQHSRLIAVLAPSGGSGSSTLAVNIATVLARRHQSSLLIDLKLEAGDLADHLNLRPEYTLADSGRNLERMDEVMFERTLTRHESGVRLLPPPQSPGDIGRITPAVIQQAITMGRAMFPYVVADLEHSFREKPLVVLKQADVILLVVRLDFPSLRNARRMLAHLDRHDVPRDRVRVVANRHGQAKEVPYDKAELALEAKIAHFIPDDVWTVNRAVNNGVPVVLDAPRAKVSKRVEQLAFSVNGLHEARPKS